MIKLQFSGYSDDTFGYRSFDLTGKPIIISGNLCSFDDFDDCARGIAIEYIVHSESLGLGVVVTGQFCPNKSGGWMIGISNYNPDSEDRPYPNWITNIQPDHANNPVLTILVPNDILITNVQSLMREIS